MKAGVSTACLYPLETEKSLAILANAGIKTTEIFLNSPSETEKEFLKELKIIADSFGVEITALHPYTSGIESLMFFTDYKRRFFDGIEMYKTYFEAVNILGGKIVVFHGMNKKLSMPMAEYADRYGKLLEAANKQGALLCHENVERSVSRSPEFFTKLNFYLPHARFVFDIKQAIRSSYNPFEIMAAMGKNIEHVHVSDNTEELDCLPIGNGNFNFRKLINQLKDISYNGSLMLELYNYNFKGIEELKNSYNSLHSIL